MWLQVALWSKLAAGRGGARKPAKRTKIVQELGRVSLGSNLCSFAFVFYISSLTLPNFIIKHVTPFTLLSFWKRLCTQGVQVCPGHLSGSPGMRFLCSRWRQPGEQYCGGRRKMLPDWCPAGSKWGVLFGEGQRAARWDVPAGGRKKILL